MHKLAAFVVVALLSLLTAFAFVPAPERGPGAIEEMLKGFFKALDAGDRAGAQACINPKDSHFPVLVYDLDHENKPVTHEGAEASTKYLDSIFDSLQKSQARVVSKIGKIHADCHSPELGYATLEFSQAVTIGTKTETSSYRATALVTYEKQDRKWRIFHWHASLAQTPITK